MTAWTRRAAAGHADYRGAHSQGCQRPAADPQTHMSRRTSSTGLSRCTSSFDSELTQGAEVIIRKEGQEHRVVLLLTQLGISTKQHLSDGEDADLAMRGSPKQTQNHMRPPARYWAGRGGRVSRVHRVSNLITPSPVQRGKTALDDRALARASRIRGQCRTSQAASPGRQLGRRLAGLDPGQLGRGNVEARQLPSACTRRIAELTRLGTRRRLRRLGRSPNTTSQTRTTAKITTITTITTATTAPITTITTVTIADDGELKAGEDDSGEDDQRTADDLPGGPPPPRRQHVH